MENSQGSEMPPMGVLSSRVQSTQANEEINQSVRQSLESEPTNAHQSATHQSQSLHQSVNSIKGDQIKEEMRQMVTDTQQIIMQQTQGNSFRSVIPISHMKHSQMQIIMQKQEELASDSNTADVSNPDKLNPLVVKGAVTIPASANSSKNYGNRPANSSSQHVVQDEQQAKASDLNLNTQEKKPKKLKQEDVINKASLSALSSDSDMQSDQTLPMHKEPNQKAKEVGASKFRKDQQLNMDLISPVIKNQPAETVSLVSQAIGTPKSNKSGRAQPPFYYQALQPYILENVEGGNMPLASQLDEKGETSHMGLPFPLRTAQNESDKSKTAFQQTAKMRSGQPTIPIDQIGVGLQDSAAEWSPRSQSKVFMPLQGKTISFAKSSGYNTSKNVTRVDSQNPFKIGASPKNIQLSPQISKPIVLVTKRSERSLAGVTGTSEKLSTIQRERIGFEKETARESLPTEMPMTIEPFHQDRVKSPGKGDKQKIKSPIKFKEHERSNSRLKTTKQKSMTKRTDAGDELTSRESAVFLIKTAQQENSDRQLLDSSNKPRLVQHLQDTEGSLSTDQHLGTPPPMTARQQSKSVLKNIGIGTSHSHGYPDDTIGSSSVQSARSNVQRIIHAANSEQADLIKQSHLQQMKKHKTPTRVRVQEERNVSTLLLPVQRESTRLVVHPQPPAQMTIKQVMRQKELLNLKKVQEAESRLGVRHKSLGAVLPVRYLTREDDSLINTMEAADERNVFDKKFSAQHIVMPQKVPESIITRDHREGSQKKPSIPQSLYYTNGYMPKLADLRDALKSNKIFHNRYNPELDDPQFKKYFKDAIKKTTTETKGETDENHENQDLLKFIIPRHQKEIDQTRRALDDRLAYIAKLGSLKQQRETDTRLTYSKGGREEYLGKLAKQLEPPPYEFKARMDPFRFRHTIESINQTFEGTLPKGHPEKKLMHWIAQQQAAERELPENLFMADPKMNDRIKTIIFEENKKMQANESENMKFERLKKDVEWNVDQGFSYKEAFAQMRREEAELRRQGSQSSIQVSSVGEEKGLALSQQQSSLLKSLGMGSDRQLLKSDELDQAAQMHFSTIGTDRATPDLKERQRPAEDSQKRISIKAPGPKPLNLKSLQTPKKASAKKSLDNKDIQIQITPKSIKKVSVVRQTITEARESQEGMSVFQSPNQHDRSDSQQRASFSNLEKYAKAQKFVSGAEELRQSKGQQELNRTHQSPLRQSKEAPLVYQSLDKGQQSVENDESSQNKMEKQSKESPAVDVSEIVQDVQKQLVRDNSVIMIPKGERILMTDKSKEALGLNHGMHAVSNPNIQFTQPLDSRQPSGLFVSNPSNNELSILAPNQNQQPGFTSRVPVNRSEKEVQKLYKPQLGKASCNNCIQKAQAEYKKQQDYIPVPSLSGTTKAGSSILDPTSVDMQSQSLLDAIQPADNSEDSKQTRLKKMQKYAESVIRGILKECDVTKQVLKVQDKKLLHDLKKDRNTLEGDIGAWDAILYDVDEAMQAGEAPLWDDVKDLKLLEHNANEQILQDVRWIKKRDEARARELTEMVKWDMENRKLFKPSPFKFNAEVHLFLYERSEEYAALVTSARPHPSKFDK